MTAFLSGRFLGFVAAAVLVYWACPKPVRPLALLVANLAFLALLLGPRGALGMVGIALALHGLIRRQQAAKPARRARWTWLGVALLVGGLVADRLWKPRGLGWDATPGSWIGYSFLAFRLIDALLVAQAGRLPRGGFLNFLNFALFFPSFTAGPIDSLRAWRESPASETLDGGLLAHGVSRILSGLIKKYVLAGLLVPYSLMAYPDPAGIPSALAAWTVTIAFTLVVYLDFSGYTDIAVGVGRCLGYRLPENFDRPFFRRDLAGFWEGWHMSLTGWLRRHVFIPLSLAAANAGLPERLAVGTAYVTTMLAVGLWHGFAWRWVLFGLLHGTALVALRAWAEIRPSWWRMPALASGLATFAFVCLTVSLVIYPAGAFWTLLIRCAGAS